MLTNIDETASAPTPSGPIKRRLEQVRRVGDRLYIAYVRWQPMSDGTVKLLDPVSIEKPLADILDDAALKVGGNTLRQILTALGASLAKIPTE